MGRSKLELKWLEDFLSLAETQNFSQSAKLRFVTQSAFSRRIKSLELWLGVKLIDRGSYPTQLTDAGKEFRKLSLKIVTDLYHVRSELRQSTGAERWVEITAQNSLTLNFFPVWLEAIEEKLGHVKTRVSTNNLHDCMQSLLSGRVDFIIVYGHPEVTIFLDDTQHPRVEIGVEQLVPVSAVKAGGPKYHLGKSVPGGIPLLSYGSGSQLGRVVELMLEARPDDQKPNLKPIFENSVAEALKLMAVAGHGIAWVPRKLIQNELDAGTLMIAGDESWHADMVIYLYRNIELNDLANRVWNAALAHIVR